MALFVKQRDSPTGVDVYCPITDDGVCVGLSYAGGPPSGAKVLGEFWTDKLSKKIHLEVKPFFGGEQDKSLCLFCYDRGKCGFCPTDEPQVPILWCPDFSDAGQLEVNTNRLEGLLDRYNISCYAQGRVLFLSPNVRIPNNVFKVVRWLGFWVERTDLV